MQKEPQNRITKLQLKQPNVSKMWIGVAVADFPWLQPEAISQITTLNYRQARTWHHHHTASKTKENLSSARISAIERKEKDPSTLPQQAKDPNLSTLLWQTRSSNLVAANKERNETATGAHEHTRERNMDITSIEKNIFLQSFNRSSCYFKNMNT